MSKQQREALEALVGRPDGILPQCFKRNTLDALVARGWADVRKVEYGRIPIRFWLAFPTEAGAEALK